MVLVLKRTIPPCGGSIYRRSLQGGASFQERP
jgi:hypothetical protein